MKRFCRGSFILVGILFAGLILLVASPIVTLIIREFHNTYLAGDALKALALAEAGVDRAVYELRRDPSYTGTSSPVDIGIGSYQITVTYVDENERIVTSRGMALGSNEERTIRARVKKVTFAFKDAAMVGGSEITVGNLRTQTVDAYGNPISPPTAALRTNGNATLNNAFIDGSVTAVGTLTVGSNVQINDSSYPSGLSGAPPIKLPDEDAISYWKTSWWNIASSGTIYPSSVTINGVTTLTAPCVINGDLTLNPNSVLTIVGSGVCWVKGNLRMRSNTQLISKVFLVVEGTVTQDSNSSYSVASDLPENMRSQIALVSLARPSSGPAISFNSNTVQSTGLVFAPYGDIEIGAGSTIWGSLWAGKRLVQTNNSQSTLIQFPSGFYESINLFRMNFQVVEWQEL